MAGWTTGIVVVVIIFLVLARVVSGGGGGTTATGTTPASASLLNKLTSIPEHVFASVGKGSVKTMPQPLNAPALTADGKPTIVYLGAEYCPYCAAERWGMVIALSRFGSFSNLQTTHSSSTDVFPSTATFSFHGANYTSKYLVFNGVETMSNVAQGSSYAPLDTPTADEEALVTKYDAAPYVPSASAGSIPFVDFDGKFLISGASYDPGLLQGKTANQIASNLTNPNDSATKGVIGTANVITAMICTLTNNQPSNVCASSTIKGLQQTLSSEPDAGTSQ
jgi:hypothetical protein